MAPSATRLRHEPPYRARPRHPYFLAGDGNEETVLLTGAVAVDLPAQVGGAFGFRPLRAPTARERELAAGARERSQEVVHAPRPRPSPPKHPALGR